MVENGRKSQVLSAHPSDFGKHGGSPAFDGAKLLVLGKSSGKGGASESQQLVEFVDLFLNLHRQLS